jgi:hypothetical protein
MKQVFVAQHPTEAHLVQGILESQGIGAEVRSEGLFAVRGEAPMTPDTLPSVWIHDDGDLDRALSVVRDVQTGGATSRDGGEAWTCPSCGEAVEPQFAACWQCGAGRPGGS